MSKFRFLTKRIIPFLIVYALMFLTIFYSAQISAGIRQGIETAINLLIPSTFFFLILSNLIVQSSLGEAAASPFRFLAGSLLRIPAREITVLLLSLVGGYPVGAKLLGDGVRSGRISRETGERMLAYCVNCGPSFLIGGVGQLLFGSALVGGALFVSQIAASLFVGFLSSFTLQKGRLRRCHCDTPPDKEGSSSHKAAFSPAVFVESVTNAVRSMGIICGFVVLFSAIIPVLQGLLREGSGSVLVQGLLEVTSGCSLLPKARELDPVLMAAVFTAFGGICVHLQVCAMLHSSGISMKRFFFFRPVYVGVSVLVTRLLISLIPNTINCMSVSGGFSRRLVSVSPAASFFLILLALMLLFFQKRSGERK